MPQKFVNLENLTSFWGNAKEYIGNERKEIEDQLYNWQKTEKALKVQCEPVPNSELHPVVEFKFKEALPEGEKSPSNPSVISGVNIIDLYKYGKNLCNLINTSTSATVTCTANGDGSYTLNGTATGGMAQFTVLWSGKKLPCKKGEFFTISGCPNGGSNNTYSTYVELRDKNLTWVKSAYDNGNSATLEVTVDGYLVYSILVKQGTTISNLVFKPQLEYGKVATEFEKPSYNEYIINLNDTYYGGFIDLFTGLMTVTHRYVQANRNTILYNTPVSNSIETFWQFIVKDLRYDDDGYFPAEVYNYQYNQGFKSDKYASNCFNWTSTNITNRVERSFSISYNYIYITLEGTSAEDARQTLLDIYDTCISNNTPLSFVYPLLTPFTIQLTSQQIKSLSSLEGTSKRINTIYTDADSVQVEYQKYVGIDSTLDSDSVNAIQNKVVNSALNTKVSLSGDETINGTKTFSNTINGSITGNAGTVAGHIVSKDVPVNAAFTDTTYDPATQSTAGLMSASDKVKLDAVGSVFSFKGSVTDSSSLSVSDNTNGDAYLAEDTGHVHVYDGTSFVDIGIWAGIPSATDAQIDALFED